MSELKLNLGCGQNKMPGYVNVDKCGQPDVLFDLETFPWPWETNSVDEINMRHILEHLGATVETYFRVIKEIYRVSKPGAKIDVSVPHPQHPNFFSDPTHVRPITPHGLALFSKTFNRLCAEKGLADSPLGLYLDVDFDVVKATQALDEKFLWLLKNGWEEKKMHDYINSHVGVIQETIIELKVVK